MEHGRPAHSRVKSVEDTRFIIEKLDLKPN
jgi:hypothetical protein